MEREELDTHKPCAACRELVAEGLAASFEFGEDDVLCWDCAVERGGSYDVDEDRWLVAPNTSDLVTVKQTA